MSAPSYDAETLAEYFKPLDPSWWEHPIVGPALRRLESLSLHVIPAVADVDRSLIYHSMTLSPEQRLAELDAWVEAMERLRGER